MSKLITQAELATLKQGAQATFNEAGGDKVIPDFQARIDKGNRYLAGLRDLDPKPTEKIDVAIERLAGIEKELREFRLKYELKLRVYQALYDLASLTTDKKLALTRCVPGEATGLHNALQLRMEDLGIDLLLDLSYDGVPF